MNAPQRGNKHIARGRAKRHPGDNTIASIRPERAKALIIRQLHFHIRYVFMLLPLQGAGIVDVLFPGCRFALPRAMCSLPFQGASILYPSDYVV